MVFSETIVSSYHPAILCFTEPVACELDSVSSIVLYRLLVNLTQSAVLCFTGCLWTWLSQPYSALQVVCELDSASHTLLYRLLVNLTQPAILCFTGCLWTWLSQLYSALQVACELWLGQPYCALQVACELDSASHTLLYRLLVNLTQPAILCFTGCLWTWLSQPYSALKVACELDSASHTLL